MTAPLPSTGATALLWDWMACSSIVGDTDLTGEPLLGMPIVTAPNSPYAAGSTPIYQGQIIDPRGNGIPAAALLTLTLSIVDTLTGAVVNDVSQIDILNTGRGTVDGSGNVTIALEAGDTEMALDPGAAQVQRSMIIDWTYDWTMPPSPVPASAGSGRHQVNFIVQALAGL